MSGLKYISLFLLALPLLARSQTLQKDTEVGLMLGGMNYIGDLNAQKITDKVNFAASAIIRYDFHPRWAV